MDETVRDLLQYLSENIKNDDNSYRGKDEYILDYSGIDDFEEAKKKLNEYKIGYEELYNNQLIVKLNKETVGARCYFNEKEYLKEFDNHSEDNFVIIKYKNSFLYYEKQAKMSYNLSGEISDYFVKNTIAYIALLKKLMTKPFADYCNFATNEIVFYTSSKGVFKLKYPAVKPNLGSETDLSPIVEELMPKLESADYMNFFKNEVIEIIKQPSHEQVSYIINRLPQILESAQRNYEIYIKNFSFDSLKSKLQVEKEKYFGSLREILGKILTQLIGIPVSISASLFASYNVKNDYVILIILFAFLVYCCFIIHTLSLYLKDVGEIKQDFIKDFEVIKEKSGLQEEVISLEKAKINDRIKSIKLTISIIGAATLILSILLYVFLGLQLLNSFSYTMIFIALLILYSIFRIILDWKYIS